MLEKLSGSRSGKEVMYKLDIGNGLQFGAQIKAYLEKVVAEFSGWVWLIKQTIAKYGGKGVSKCLKLNGESRLNTLGVTGTLERRRKLA